MVARLLDVSSACPRPITETQRGRSSGKHSANSIIA
jgi:hypothetical protein